MVKIEISLSKIFEYVGDRSRPLKEGESVFKAGHVILCGLEDANSLKIKSLCLQTSALTSPPHELSIVLQNDDIKNWKCLCSCKAGMSGFCKHIVAILIYINRHEDLEVLSCTDLQQKWGKEKKGIEETYKAKPFKEFCHPVKRKTYSFRTSCELDKENFALLSAGVADSALTKFLSRRSLVDQAVAIDSNSNEAKIKCLIAHASKSPFLNELKQQISVDSYELRTCCKQLINDLTNANVLEVAKCEQGTHLWSKERQLRITGSTCYSIYTYGKTGSWEDKSKKFFFPKHFSNKFTEHGKKYEKKAFEKYVKDKTCEAITTGLVISEIFPWLGFSPDGIIFENNMPTELIEIKCPFLGKTMPVESFLDSCDFLDRTSSVPKLKEKHAYYGQVQLGMALLNLTETSLIVYSSFSESYLEILIKFDCEFTKKLIKKISDEYFVNMLHFYCVNKD